MVRFDVQLLSVQLIFITDKRINFGNPGMCYRNLIDSVTPSNGGRYYEQVKMIIQKQVIKRIKQIKKDIYMKTYLNIIELHNLSISMSEAGTCNALRK